MNEQDVEAKCMAVRMIVQESVAYSTNTGS